LFAYRQNEAGAGGDVIFVGIDPGITGGIAIYDGDMHDLVALHRMPIDRIMVGGREKKRVSEAGVLKALEGLKFCRAAIERPTIRPFNKRNKADGTLSQVRMGSAGAAAFGENFGVLRMACIASGLSLRECQTNEWKSALKLRGGKDDSRRKASEEFPAWRGNFVTKNSDGCAEAALIALWLSKLK
jgi:crossover junction endodeoxyribonuclease RuvC